RTDASATPVKKPRIGLVSSPNSMDEGWTRWVLDMYGFTYERLTADQIQAGSLRDKIDVLLVTNESSVGGGGGRGGRARWRRWRRRSRRRRGSSATGRR